MRDHVILAGSIALVTVGTLMFQMSPFVWTVLYFGLPACYLLSRKPEILKSAIIPTGIFGCVYGWGFEYVSEVSNAWIFPRGDEFIWPHFFFGQVSLDVMVWYALWVFTMICYYEYFISQQKQRVVMRRVYKVLGMGVAGLLSIAILKYVFSIEPVIPYAYAVLGSVTVLPLAVLYRRKPYTFPRLIRMIPFFGLLFLAMELSALAVGYWEFTGSYVYTIPVLGHVIPIEELLFWIIGSPLIITAYHELLLSNEE